MPCRHSVSRGRLAAAPSRARRRERRSLKSGFLVIASRDRSPQYEGGPSGLQEGGCKCVFASSWGRSPRLRREPSRRAPGTDRDRRCAPFCRMAAARVLQLGEGTLSFRDQFVALPHLGFHNQAAAPGMEDAGDAAHLAVGDGADVVDLAFQGTLWRSKPWELEQASPMVTSISENSAPPCMTPPRLRRCAAIGRRTSASTPSPRLTGSRPTSSL